MLDLAGVRTYEFCRYENPMLHLLKSPMEMMALNQKLTTMTVLGQSSTRTPSRIAKSCRCVIGCKTGSRSHSPHLGSLRLVAPAFRICLNGPVQMSRGGQFG